MRGKAEFELMELDNITSTSSDMSVETKMIKIKPGTLGKKAKPTYQEISDATQRAYEEGKKALGLNKTFKAPKEKIKEYEMPELPGDFLNSLFEK